MQSGETAGEGKLIAEMLNWGAKNKIFFWEVVCGKSELRVAMGTLYSRRGEKK